MKYEIEIVNFEEEMQDGGFHSESEIATLTGLGWEDMYDITSKVKRWTGQAYIKTFRTLGFNCNTRWIKFDKNTEYPCMIRCKIPHDKHHWASWIYYDGHIYDIREGKITWAKWNSWWPNYKITSMLQVWISTDTKINELTDK